MAACSESPCIGICSTVYGDNFCRGCKRNFLEVIDWNRYSPAQKQQINQRLQQQLEQVVAEFLVIVDVKKLKLHLDQIALRPPIYASPLCWAYEVLRLKAAQINDISLYGLQAKPPYHSLTANSLFTQIDDCLYKLTQQSQ